MSLIPQRLRSKSISSPLQIHQTASQSCPNLFDLDEDRGEDNTYTGPYHALTPSPSSSPKLNKPRKLHKSLFLLPSKFRRAKERRDQTQELKLPLCPLSPLSEDPPNSAVDTPHTNLEPPLNVRPKHTRPTGLGLGLGRGLLGSNLISPGRLSKLRRGSDSSILSPTNSGDGDGQDMLDIEHSGRLLTQRRSSLAPPSSAPPIFIVVSRSGNERGGDGLKRYLGKSLEQV